MRSLILYTVHFSLFFFFFLLLFFLSLLFLCSGYQMQIHRNDKMNFSSNFNHFPQIDPLSNNVVVVLHIHYCATNNKQLWMGLLCSYKGVLLLFGLFLAWETRHVQIPALNDSHHIGKLSLFRS